MGKFRETYKIFPKFSRDFPQCIVFSGTRTRCASLLERGVSSNYTFIINIKESLILAN